MPCPKCHSVLFNGRYCPTCVYAANLVRINKEIAEGERDEREERTDNS